MQYLFPRSVSNAAAVDERTLPDISSAAQESGSSITQFPLFSYKAC